MSDLLDLALDGHGGLERFRILESISVTLTAGGALFAFKGYPSGLGTVRATADVTTPRLTYTPFASWVAGKFEPDRVTLVAADDTEQQRRDPRNALARLADDAPWDDLHLLHFTGYAMWNYLCAPFFLSWPGFAAEEIEPWYENGEAWRRLRVTFPPDVPTHSTEQDFYFDDAGLLRRHDYAPELLGSGTAAHYCDGHREFSGLTMPTRRRVYPRREDGTPNTDLALVEIDISEVAVR